MTIKEAISQLEDLRKDRQSFRTGRPDDDEILNADIEAIDVALEQMQIQIQYTELQYVEDQCQGIWITD